MKAVISLGHSPLEDNSCSCGQEVSLLILDPIVHCRVEKSPLLSLKWDISIDHTLKLLLRIHFNYSQSTPPSSEHTSAFKLPNRRLCMHFSSAHSYKFHLSHPSRIVYINSIGQKIKILEFLKTKMGFTVARYRQGIEMDTSRTRNAVTSVTVHRYYAPWHKTRSSVVDRTVSGTLNTSRHVTLIQFHIASKNVSCEIRES